MLEKTLIILPSSTFLLLYTSCWTLGNPFTYHHSPHFPALPRRLYALMIEWISQLKTILSNGHNGLRGSSSFLMNQNVWKLPKNVSFGFSRKTCLFTFSAICLHFLLFVYFFNSLFTFSTLCLLFQIFVYFFKYLFTFSNICLLFQLFVYILKLI